MSRALHDGLIMPSKAHRMKFPGYLNLHGPLNSHKNVTCNCFTVLLDVFVNYTGRVPSKMLSKVQQFVIDFSIFVVLLTALESYLISLCSLFLL